MVECFAIRIRPCMQLNTFFVCDSPSPHGVLVYSLLRPLVHHNSSNCNSLDTLADTIPSQYRHGMPHRGPQTRRSLLRVRLYPIS